MKRRIVLGFALAAVLLALLVNAVGEEEVLAELARADYRVLALGVASGLLSLAFRGLVWVRFLAVVDATMTARRVGSIFLAAMFVKYATPYGQIATEPFVAYLVSRDGKMDYENGLAGIVSADLLNYVPYYTFGFLAVGSIAVGGPVGEDLRGHLLAFAGLFVVVATVSYVVFRRPGTVYRVVLAATATGRTVSGRLTPRFEEYFAPTVVRERLDGFYWTIAELGADRRNLAIATAYAHLGMAFLMAPVYVGALALGYDVGFAVVALVVALGKLGTVVPAPGGLGGVEGIVTAGLTVLGSLDPAAAFTIALIFRLCTYWLTLVVGGASAIGFVFRG